VKNYKEIISLVTSNDTKMIKALNETNQIKSHMRIKTKEN